MINQLGFFRDVHFSLQKSKEDSFVSDGWTKNDLVYVWKDSGPVQIPKNLSLPGGFKLSGFGNQYCDVITATGKNFASCLQLVNYKYIQL